MTTEREQQFLELLKNEVKPALGCTEPIAVSLAVSKASEQIKQLGEDTTMLKVEVSANILKNGMGVGVPGTGMVGLHIAAALGVTCGRSEYKLEVLKDIDNSSLELAKKMVKEGNVTISLSPSSKKLYISAFAYSSNHEANVIIEDNHDNISEIYLDGKRIVQQEKSGCDSHDNHSNTNLKGILDYKLTLDSIYQFSLSVPFKEIEFILDSAKLNKALANEGLENNYGLRVGKTINNGNYSEVFGNGLLSYSMALTAAASDARMAGSTLPAMSNSGSGNQGITVTMPVIAFAEKLESSQESLARALVLSHLVAIHIKGYLGKLSALCGCVIASTGAACGIVYLKNGNFEQMGCAIKNMIGNITGMVCDGAKVGCALKVASGVSSAVQSAMLAMDGICISENDGIIEKDIEKTIMNLGKIGSVGMEKTDQMILDIMVSK